MLGALSVLGQTKHGDGRAVLGEQGADRAADAARAPVTIPTRSLRGKLSTR